MAFGYTHRSEPVTLGTFHGHTLTATVERYEVRLSVLGVHAQWCTLLPRAVEAASAAGEQSVALRQRTYQPRFDLFRRVRAGLGR